MTVRTIPWGSVLLSATAAVSWAFLAMTGTAALGLHLLRADTAGSLGPMTAAVVAMAVGGRVSPSGDVTVFGLGGAGAEGAIAIMPLGVSLVGALLLSWVFLRSLRPAGTVIGAGELLARAAAVAVLFLGLVAGLAWAGQDTIAIDGPSLGDGLPEELPGLGDIGGGLADELEELIDAEASVGFHVDTAASLGRGLLWVLAVLLIALLASRRTPLPRGWEPLHRVVRPAVSALSAALLLAVLAGLVAAGWAAATDDEPGRIVGSALLGAPNGVWLGVTLGLFVPWEGTATGQLARLLPDPLDRLLARQVNEPITPGRLAELDRVVWLLPVAAVLMMLAAGALAAARTPRPAGAGASAGGRAGFVGRCALRLGVVSAAAFPLLVWLAGVSVNANLSVFGFDAVDAGIDLSGSLPAALALGAAWGAVAGGLGALLSLGTGAAGRRAAPFALGRGAFPREPGPYNPRSAYRPPQGESNPYKHGPVWPGAVADSPYGAPTMPGTPFPPSPGGPGARPPGTGWPEPPPPPERRP